MDFDNLLSGPSAAHWLGSDQMGRDTLARLIVGARIALSVSLGAVGLGVLPRGRGWVGRLWPTVAATDPG